MAKERQNERKTEALFEKKFEEKNESSTYNLEHQGSDIAEIKRLLSNASKTGKGGHGKPEFIITNSKYPNYVIVVECKGNTNQHKSPNLDNARDYAVDGVLHYSRFLSESYNVIAIAVSGDETDLIIDNYFVGKGCSDHTPFVDKYGADVKTVLSFDDYMDLIIYDPDIEKQQTSDLLSFSKSLHDFMYSHAKLTEEQKPLLVSGSLIALQDKIFLDNFDKLEIDRLPSSWLDAIKFKLDQAKIPADKIHNMLISYSQIKEHPEMQKSSVAFPKGILSELILRIKTHLIPLVRRQNGIDVMGQFYGEFLKYTAGDGKGLGIVLTPKHITELFCDLVDLKPTDKVLDLCTGTGGFLISSMDYMIKKAIKQNPEEEARTSAIDNIKRNGLIGVEQQPHMFALAASNMILRGDGKSNLYQGSCFNEEIVNEIKKHQCNVGFINPPYSQKDRSELEFIDHMLDCLEPGGTGVAIIPMSCTNSHKKNNAIKARIMSKHTLKATMSLPDKLFYPVGTITMILIFEAHTPHSEDDKSWFGYWKDDGFKVIKHNGRKDMGSWIDIKKEWQEMYKDKRIKIGQSAHEKVSNTDEWACETFLETDHKAIESSVFIDEIMNYSTFKFLNKNIFGTKIISDDCFQPNDSLVKNEEWRPYKYSELFEIKSANNYQNNVIENSEKGTTPFITSSALNNGCDKFADVEAKIEGNTISVSKDGSVCYAFFQEKDWSGNGHIYAYKPKNNGFNKYHAFFLIPLINSERYKFNFGRSFKKEIMNETIIQLPSIFNAETNKYQPDWEYMESYIKSLPYSKNL